ncbi:dynamin family protein [Dolichospermum circinale]|uniref:dynamin family protein n=1 Tax=Dolichospermum circinale TaxID=109265 RepID=UPI0004018B34|nr:dynamin family protein [Dolichospermum circinale]
MSNNVLKSDIYALQKSVVSVLSQVLDLMNYASQNLETPNSEDRRWSEEAKSIENEITKVKNLELRMAIVAPMKAGKSTIINAIVGQDILPSRNTAMTTLPTEIVFSKEVTEPKLKLRYEGADTFDVLRRSWRSLKGKINQIGLDQAKESTKDYPHLQYLLEDVAGNPELSFAPETSGTEPIQTALTKLNDLVRLCSVLVPSDNALMSLVSVPRLEVPFSETESSLKLDGVGKLVFVDTPGPNEAGALKLDDVVKRQLDASSIVLLVLDFTQLNTDAAEKVKSDVDKVAKIKGLESIYILINKIDQRKEKGMTKEEVLEFVNSKFGIAASTDRVFEISASRAAYASNFRAELRLNPSISDPTLMKTSEPLARQAFGDMWEDLFPEATIEGMTKASDRIWSKSGFAEFLEKAIAALMIQAAPLTLFNALNDVRFRLTKLQESIQLQKSAFGKDIQTLQGQIAALERDLTILVDCQNKLKTRVNTLATNLEQELTSSLRKMKEESIAKFKRIFDKREFDEAGWTKYFVEFLSRWAELSGVKQGAREFNSKAEADRFIEETTASARNIVNALMINAREDALKKVTQSRQKIESLIKRESLPVIQQAQRRLAQTFNVNLQLPDILGNIELEHNIRLDVSVESDVKTVYEAGEMVKERRWYTLGLWEHNKEVKERIWYSLWLWEHNDTSSTGQTVSRKDWDGVTRIYDAKAVEKEETLYKVSIDEITNSFNQSISSAVNKVTNQILSYLQDDFQSGIDSFFAELDQFLKSYQDDLKKSIEAGKRSAEDRAALSVAFDYILDKSPQLINDFDRQKGYVNELLPKRKQ